MNKLPSFFRQEVLSLIESSTEQYLFKYLNAPNSEDKVVLVGKPFVIDKLMDVIIKVPPEILNEKDWWSNGFIEKGFTSSKCSDHLDLVAYATELCTKIYQNHHNSLTK